MSDEKENVIELEEEAVEADAEIEAEFDADIEAEIEAAVEGEDAPDPDSTQDNGQDQPPPIDEPTIEWYGPRLAEVEPAREACGIPDATNISVSATPPQQATPKPPLHVTFAQNGISPDLLDALAAFAEHGGMVAVWSVENAIDRQFRLTVHRHKFDIDYLPRAIRGVSKMADEMIAVAERPTADKPEQ